MSAVADASVTIVGLGNIGSHLVPHIGRTAGIGRVTLVDSDTYEAKNIASQDVRRHEVLEPKAVVQARRLRDINPALAVAAIVDAVENVPLGLLRATVVLACLDSRAARRTVSVAAWRLGVPWIDSGVNGDELLARVNVYWPGPDQPCLECPWDEADYAALEQEYPCAGTPAVRATNAPAALGGLAASLQALECRKLLAGAREQLAIGSQVTLSALGHRHFVTRFMRNPACRFDHEVWDVEPLAASPERLSVGDAFALGRGAAEASASRRLRIAHQMFVRGLVCPGCGERREVHLQLLGRVRAALRTCVRCGRALRGSGADVCEWLPEDAAAGRMGEVPLASLGIRSGDVISVAGPSRTMHFQIGGS